MQLFYARQRIHMKHQALFSLKDKSKYFSLEPVWQLADLILVVLSLCIYSSFCGCASTGLIN